MTLNVFIEQVAEGKFSFMRSFHLRRIFSIGYGRIDQCGLLTSLFHRYNWEAAQ